jgi:hypothetical protein
MSWYQSKYRRLNSNNPRSPGLTVVAFHLLYSFIIWPFKSCISTVTRALFNLNAQCITDFPFIQKDLRAWDGVMVKALRY